MQPVTEDQMRELQEAYNKTVLAMFAKRKRSCGPNCKLCQKERENSVV